MLMIQHLKSMCWIRHTIKNFDDCLTNTKILYYIQDVNTTLCSKRKGVFYDQQYFDGAGYYYDCDWFGSSDFKSGWQIREKEDP